MPKPKAILLYSGGLDSILSYEVLKRAGVDVVPLRFQSVFFGAAARKHYLPEGEVLTRDISDRMIELIKAPRYGYGKNLNPCIDCKQMMYGLAWEEARRCGADFIATGEVLGQRPKSQRIDAFRCMEKGAGVEGLVVRPLSAKRLPPTVPEKSGMIDREKLLGLRGRSRKPQMALARQWGIEEYPSPAGGCQLTDPNYAARARTLLELGALNVENARLVQNGRFYPLAHGAFAVVGRNHEDNLRVLKHAPVDSKILELVGRPGPVACLVGEADSENVAAAKRLVIAHSRFKDLTLCEVQVLSAEHARAEWAAKSAARKP